MITAFAKAGTVLKDRSYVERAIKVATFLRKNLYRPESGRLLHCCYRGLEEGTIAQKYTHLYYAFNWLFKDGST